jgi:hypothetical protein
LKYFFDWYITESEHFSIHNTQGANTMAKAHTAHAALLFGSWLAGLLPEGLTEEQMDVLMCDQEAARIALTKAIDTLLALVPKPHTPQVILHEDALCGNRRVDMSHQY